MSYESESKDSFYYDLKKKMKDAKETKDAFTI